MLDQHPAEEDLVMFFYREGGLLGSGTPDQLEAHLEQCESCRTAYCNLVRVLEACDDLPVPEPHAAFESRLWNRLEPQLRPLHTAHRWWQLPDWTFVRSRWFAAAAVAALVVLAFFAGRITRPRSSRPGSSQMPAQVAMSADGRERVLLTALGEHIERSEMMLVELANGRDNSSDLSANRRRARNLISENRLYRQTAGDTANPSVVHVLDQLERVLLDISHGGDVNEIKSRIESEDLLFKLRVLGSNLQQSAGEESTPNLTPAKSKDTL